jgi:phospholipid transport system substrate-binding protein
METLFGRRDLLALTAALVAVAAAPARGQDSQGVVAPVQKLVDGLLRIMKEGNSTRFAHRFDMIAPIVDSSFDLETILREAVGPTWSTLPPDQQQMLFQAFRRYTVASYVNNFDSYGGQHFEVQPTPRPVGNGEMVVKTEIVSVSGTRHELDYVMRQGSGGGWHAVDVLADGSVSQVAVERSDFRRLLNRGGAQALADSLSRKSADLSDGSG